MAPVPSTGFRGSPSGGARADLYFDTTAPLNPVKTRSRRIEIASTAGERADVSDEGYRGIAAKEGETYEFSMCARSNAGFDGPVTVSLERKNGDAYGQTRITGLKPDWCRFTGSFRSKGMDPAARLVIDFYRFFTENRYTVLDLNFSPGFNVVVGNPG
jgi:hypothetical protein